jgi:3-oxoadipate enol-lactonase
MSGPSKPTLNALRVQLPDCDHRDKISVAAKEAEAMSAIRTSTGRRIFYDDFGAGPALLMIPGGVGSRRGIFTPLIEALISRHRVITMDNRDSGESELETNYYSVSDLADDAVALLDALCVTHTRVLWYSFSGFIALQMALDHPDRIDRMILISASARGEQGHRAGEPAPPPADWWDDDRVEWVRRAVSGAVGPDYQGRLAEEELSAIAELERGNRATWSSVLHRTAAEGDTDFSHVLPRVAAPTLVVHGDQDRVMPPEEAQLLSAGIPNAHLVMLPGVGHFPWLEQPDKAISAILDFLGSAR